MGFEDRSLIGNLLWAVPLFLLFLLFLKFKVYLFWKKLSGKYSRGFLDYLKKEWSFIFIFLSLLFLFLGFFKFRIGEKYSEEIRGNEKNIYFIFDISYSMLGNDIKPSRLEISKNVAISILDRFRGEKFGIIMFAGKGFILSPLTSDWDTVKFLISRLSPESSSSQGSDVNPSLKLLLDMTGSKSKGEKIAILFSDGEFFKKIDDSILEKLRERGIKFFTVGVATEEGSKIPDPKKGYTEPIEVNGKPIYSHLNGKNLIYISHKLGGRYVKYLNVPQVVREIIFAVKGESVIKNFPFRKKKVNGSFLLFFLSFIFFSLYFIFGRVKLKGFLFSLLLFIVFTGFISGSVADVVKKGNEFYRMGRYEKALKKYVEALNGVKKGSSEFLKINSNISLTLFKMKDYKRAIFVLENGLNYYKKNDRLKGEAYYNLGTMYLFEKNYEYARTFLENSLKLNPLDMDAKYNLEIVLRLLAKGKKKKKEKNVERNLNSLREKEKSFFEVKPKKKNFGLKGPYW